MNFTGSIVIVFYTVFFSCFCISVHAVTTQSSQLPYCVCRSGVSGRIARELKRKISCVSVVVVKCVEWLAVGKGSSPVHASLLWPTGGSRDIRFRYISVSPPPLRFIFFNSHRGEACSQRYFTQRQQWMHSLERLPVLHLQEDMQMQHSGVGWEDLSARGGSGWNNIWRI